jgi:saccharopine dehydrogenase-like NADP-dependent oxidoreductase
VGLARAAIKAGCHFADLGGNNTVVREELAMDKQAAERAVGLAPDCGLSPGMASILAGELMRRIGGKADALKVYIGTFSVVDHFDPDNGMTAMMRTTAWPASIVVQMMALGQIAKRGAVRSELDVPAGAFIAAMSQRGVRIEYSSSH